MSKKNTDVMVPMSEEMMAQLRGEFPTENSYTRILLPRFGMVSQDVTEGKGKAMKVVTEAGTFFFETQTGEPDEKGNKTWEREELGTEVEGTVLYQRKQLKYYDKSTEKFTNSVPYDSEDEEVPLFCDRKEVDRGTPAELKARKEYAGISEKTGKPKSNLEETRILFVLIKGEVYQLNLRGSSMYAWMTFARKAIPPSLLISFGSEPKEAGSNNWNQMTFTPVRTLNADEGATVLEKVAEIKLGIEAEKAFFATQTSADPEYREAEKKANKDF